LNYSPPGLKQINPKGTAWGAFKKWEREFLKI